ncbi:MAG: 3-phosphoshikimate 1-carboxyvinyltransferase, partial [Armatimonadetes bacterium]|nr:3-phosphoshikimate 1-carboxyvinyltransferase [Armatimonadota bacterium]NIO97241.1 3-phosphoshikimate 1-carboxyvinyltransferase [Armatimonadota bacterium]
ELRVKESDRVSSMAKVLKELGVDVEELPDGLIIQGKQSLKRARIDSRGDHRVAMAAAIAGQVGGEVEI